jgi:hypothetical protein
VKRKLILGIAGLSLAVAVGVGFNSSNAWATTGHKVDCDKVMAEVHGGKKTKDIDKDLNISSSSVYRCKKKAGGSASKSAGTKAASAGTAAPAGAASPK